MERKDLLRFLSKTGYKRDSQDINNPFNIIPSGDITMEGVDFPVIGVDNLGDEKIMFPGENYQFKGDFVIERPLDKMQGGGEIKNKETQLFDYDEFKKKIAHVESSDGKLMRNPQTSASGLYGQLFNEIKDTEEYDGSREDFINDLDAQNRVFDKRFYEGFENPKVPGILQSVYDLENEYRKQLGDKFDYTSEEIAILINFLGRGGTRKYLGNHIRDGKPLSEAMPTRFGNTNNINNHTPIEYLQKAGTRQSMMDYINNPKDLDSFKEHISPKDNYGLPKKYKKGGTVYDTVESIENIKELFTLEF